MELATVVVLASHAQVKINVRAVLISAIFMILSVFWIVLMVMTQPEISAARIISFTIELSRKFIITILMLKLIIFDISLMPTRAT
jgi:succinate dehydrogenase hydrophobic anchor subunit